jgi:hypothetical protein
MSDQTWFESVKPAKGTSPAAAQIRRAPDRRAKRRSKCRGKRRQEHPVNETIARLEGPLDLV